MPMGGGAWQGGNGIWMGVGLPCLSYPRSLGGGVCIRERCTWFPLQVENGNGNL